MKHDCSSSCTETATFIGQPMLIQEYIPMFAVLVKLMFQIIR